MGPHVEVVALFFIDVHSLSLETVFTFIAIKASFIDFLN